ncbi:hypothetical protein LV84_01560 [Algoriphagus ratkowskyi]|uniref:Uncharacterized protein n=1 Tax=Algoriphagus ratkowskyi TaxID=57028 RepID=A0A2W7RD54_9BACT|nr:hypothetical protein [Algoriphagus ratkowskyi]PZX58354.1 hypothetical protein LV84_01560 [Algoriphagus ratkowskyi]
MNLIEEFNEYRSHINDNILADDNTVIKRIFKLITKAHPEKSVDIKSEEMIGFACSIEDAMTA